MDGLNSSSQAAAFHAMLRLVHFSAAAYAVEPSQRVDSSSWTDEKCLDKLRLRDFRLHEVASDEEWATLAYTGYDPTWDAILVVFRGTHTIKNWRHNFRLGKSRTSIFPAEAGSFHPGFLDMYMSLRKQVLAGVEVLRCAHPSAEIYITGHSLGGALAVLGALDVKLTHPLSSPIMFQEVEGPF